MCATAFEQTLPDECFAEKQLNIFLCPLSCGQGLQEHHRFLEVHFAKLIRPFHKEGSTDVEVEG